MIEWAIQLAARGDAVPVFENVAERFANPDREPVSEFVHHRDHAPTHRRPNQKTRAEEHAAPQAVPLRPANIMRRAR
jgi:hypothetical protein